MSPLPPPPFPDLQDLEREKSWQGAIPLSARRPPTVRRALTGTLIPMVALHLHGNIAGARVHNPKYSRCRDRNEWVDAVHWGKKTNVFAVSCYRKTYKDFLPLLIKRPLLWCHSWRTYLIATLCDLFLYILFVCEDFFLVLPQLKRGLLAGGGLVFGVTRTTFNWRLTKTCAVKSLATLQSHQI